ncbi:MAG: hypothetical protein ABFD89_17325 [Bryobacteraceae bacterium]
MQGFIRRGATTTLHDASATGVSISGIFQVAEDFALLRIYNAYDYFNHLRMKRPLRTDLCGLRLVFDIEDGHVIGATVRPTIWTTLVLNEGHSLAFDILAAANPCNWLRWVIRRLIASPPVPLSALQ